MKTEVPVRKVSQKVKRPAPAGWASIRKTMQARLMAPALSALGLLKPGGRMPRSATTKGK